jgi:hypothetical protein
MSNALEKFSVQNKIFDCFVIVSSLRYYARTIAGEPHERSSFFELDHRYYRLVLTVCQPKMTKMPHMT